MSLTKNIPNAVSQARRLGPIFSGGVNINWNCGQPNQLSFVREDVGTLERKLRVWCYKQEDFCKVGLLRSDIYAEEFHSVEEARKRLTDEQTQLYLFRVNRALLLSCNKQILPPEEWTPIDAEHCYLDPLIAEIEAEKFEKDVLKCARNEYNDNWERLLLIPFRIWNYFKIKEMRDTLSKNLSVSIY